MKNILLIIDPQRDFHEGGSLSVPGIYRLNKNLHNPTFMKHYSVWTIAVILIGTRIFYGRMLNVFMFITVESVESSAVVGDTPNTNCQMILVIASER